MRAGRLRRPRPQLRRRAHQIKGAGGGYGFPLLSEVAEQLEHIKSEQLIDRLDALLGHPKFDPHGDPIPGKDGLLAEQNNSLLSELRIGQSGLCVGVKDTSTSFLQYLDKNQIALGQRISVVEKESFDQSLLIEIDGQSLRLSHQIATNLYIKID